MPGSKKSRIDTPSEKMELEKENECSRAPIRLLLVDDEKGFVDVMSKRLARHNIQTTQAFSGSEGIRLLKRSDFDVAVLDLKLGDMDGIEILKIFKKMDPHMPVIMLTGHGSQKASVEGMQYGAFDYLTKPHELAGLMEKINDAIRRREKTDDTNEITSR